MTMTERVCWVNIVIWLHKHQTWLLECAVTKGAKLPGNQKAWRKPITIRWLIRLVFTDVDTTCLLRPHIQGPGKAVACKNQTTRRKIHKDHIMGNLYGKSMEAAVADLFLKMQVTCLADLNTSRYWPGTSMQRWSSDFIVGMLVLSQWLKVEV